MFPGRAGAETTAEPPDRRFCRWPNTKQNRDRKFRKKKVRLMGTDDGSCLPVHVMNSPAFTFRRGTTTSPTAICGDQVDRRLVARGNRVK